jgi:hypothetical protein
MEIFDGEDKNRVYSRGPKVEVSQPRPNFLGGATAPCRTRRASCPRAGSERRRRGRAAGSPRCRGRRRWGSEGSRLAPRSALLRSASRSCLSPWLGDVSPRLPVPYSQNGGLADSDSPGQRGRRLH